MLLPPNLLATIPSNGPAVVRKQALDASIATLPLFLESTRDMNVTTGQTGKRGAPAALSRDEFVRQYVTLVQVVLSFILCRTSHA
jgi:hypothetical protein